MFLDCGNIFLINHFYAQSLLSGKIPEFSAESLCLRQGMATSVCW